MGATGLECIDGAAIGQMDLERPSLGLRPRFLARRRGEGRHRQDRRRAVHPREGKAPIDRSRLAALVAGVDEAPAKAGRKARARFAGAEQEAFGRAGGARVRLRAGERMPLRCGPARKRSNSASVFLNSRRGAASSVKGLRADLSRTLRRQLTDVASKARRRRGRRRLPPGPGRPPHAAGKAYRPEFRFSDAPLRPAMASDPFSGGAHSAGGSPRARHRAGSCRAHALRI